MNKNEIILMEGLVFGLILGINKVPFKYMIPLVLLNAFVVATIASTFN